MSLEDPPLFPRRDWIDDAARRRAEETPLRGTAARVHRDSSGAIDWQACGTIRALEHWVKGGTFHRYGVRLLDQLYEELGSMERAVQRCSVVRPRLKFEGELRDGHVRWVVYYGRVGDPEASGLSSGASTPEDVAYSALTMIEEREREVYEATMMIGLS